MLLLGPKASLVVQSSEKRLSGRVRYTTSEVVSGIYILQLAEDTLILYVGLLEDWFNIGYL